MDIILIDDDRQGLVDHARSIPLLRHAKAPPLIRTKILYVIPSWEEVFSGVADETCREILHCCVWLMASHLSLSGIILIIVIFVDKLGMHEGTQRIRFEIGFPDDG